MSNPDAADRERRIAVPPDSDGDVVDAVNGPTPTFYDTPTGGLPAPAYPVAEGDMFGLPVEKWSLALITGDAVADVAAWLDESALGGLPLPTGERLHEIASNWRVSPLVTVPRERVPVTDLGRNPRVGVAHVAVSAPTTTLSVSWAHCVAGLRALATQASTPAADALANYRVYLFGSDGAVLVRAPTLADADTETLPTTDQLTGAVYLPPYPAAYGDVLDRQYEARTDVPMPNYWTLTGDPLAEPAPPGAATPFVDAVLDSDREAVAAGSTNRFVATGINEFTGLARHLAGRPLEDPVLNKSTTAGQTQNETSTEGASGPSQTPRHDDHE